MSRSIRLLTCCLLGCFAFSGLSGPANAITAVEQPDGVVAGSFLIFPSLEVGYKYDDNIYATEKNKTDDQIIIGKIGAALNSDWSNHALSLSANANTGKYSKNTKEDFFDYTTSIGGRVDFLRGVNLGINFGMSNMHEDRGSPNDLYGAEPTKYNQVFGNIGFNHVVSALRLNLLLSVNQYSYDDTPTSTIIKVDQEGRNRQELEGKARLAFVIAKLYSLFIEGKYYGRDYEFQNVLRYGHIRNSTGFEATLGFSRVISEVSSFELQIGQRAQNYEEDNLKDIEGFQLICNFNWTPTEMTSFTFYVNRAIQEAILGNVSGYFTTNYGLAYDQQLSSNFLLKASYNGTQLEYHGIDRSDQQNTLGVGLYLYLNNALYFGMSGAYNSKTSNVAGGDYNRATAQVFLGGRL